MKIQQNLDQYKYIYNEVPSFVTTSCSCNFTDFPSHYPLSMKIEQNLDQYKYTYNEVPSFVTTFCSCNFTDFPSHYPLSQLTLYMLR